MKYILLLSLLISSSGLVISQTVYKVNKIQIAKRDKIAEKWVWEAEQDSNLTITKNGTTISISNEERTTISTTGFVSEQNNGRETKNIYNAIDQAGRKCFLIFVKGILDGKKSIGVIYHGSITIIFRFE